MKSNNQSSLPLPCNMKWICYTVRCVARLYCFKSLIKVIFQCHAVCNTAHDVNGHIIISNWIQNSETGHAGHTSLLKLALITDASFSNGIVSERLLAGAVDQSGLLKLVYVTERRLGTNRWKKASQPLCKKARLVCIHVYRAFNLISCR